MTMEEEVVHHFPRYRFRCPCLWRTWTRARRSQAQHRGLGVRSSRGLGRTAASSSTSFCVVGGGGGNLCYNHGDEVMTKQTHGV